MIGYLTKGGVSYRDTEDMTPYERRIVLETIKEVLEGQREEANRTVVNDPRSGMTS